MGHEYMTPEHVLASFVLTKDFENTLALFNLHVNDIASLLNEYFSKLDILPVGDDSEPGESYFFTELRERYEQEKPNYDPAYRGYLLLKLLLEEKDTRAYQILSNALGGDKNLPLLLSYYAQTIGEAEENYIDDDFDDMLEQLQNPQSSGIVVCMNDQLEGRPPLVGRADELRRTIEVLCRMEKNNPLHVGEPGVGKTALVWGLVKKIADGDVPERLKNSKVYQLDVSTLVANGQFRGEMEKKLQETMNKLSSEEGSIVYIDNIHTMVGAGRSNDSSMDATDVLKPFLDSGSLRFIGTTTPDDFKRHLERNQSLVRRFQQIEIKEPSTEEAIDILTQLKPRYEEFHKVSYSDDVIRFAVTASEKYQSDRRLPDKALDLIDASGARMEVNGEQGKEVSKEMIAEILSEVSKIGTVKIDEESENAVETLNDRILKQIYGQDEAVRLVSEAIQMSKAGLSDEGKPLASLLFVGPTGVGKTEVARVLSRELGVELLRFDMSEYTEKHTVAKLIGSPAGYVGYEDGGLLTDAIRRNPNCVLLLDEIEKAHSDIYNILLQVMDYANLTDNRGQKSDFRNVVLIMTSNAGAQYASQANIGFGGGVSRGSAMQAQVKKLFKPEFLNRLSSVVTFNDMDQTMARKILEKKIGELRHKVESRGIQLELSEEVFAQLLKEGFSKEYGAREMDRVIGSRLKPLLMREILYGKLRKGGKAKIIKNGDDIQIK
ncbi:MAG: AAA family ATPase [Bacteroidaceae bacterium]|nr:AAA family ATPase [Bacteroidaceae bacterium]